MLSIAIRSLLSRKLRGMLTGLAVFLGVAMIAGTLMLTDSVNSAFDDIFAEANAGIDVSVRGADEVDAGFDAPPSNITLDEALVERVREVEGVASADGAIGDQTITLIGEDGERLGPAQGGPPHIATSIQPEPFNAFTYIEGEAPRGPDQVAIDSIAANEHGIEVGDGLRVAGEAAAKEYEVSGIARFGTGVPLGGAMLTVFTLEEAQRLTAKEGEVDQIDVETADGVSPEELRDRLAAALEDEDVTVRTGEETAEEDASAFQEGFGFLTTALLVFAGIAVFVGAFLIFNTFSITVAQRTQEFALLRMLGASRGQVLASVVLEAALLGLLASAVGIAGGIGFVELITGLFAWFGFELPSAGLVLTPQTLIWPVVVGLLTTAVSSLSPALRATKVSPLEALQEASGSKRRRGLVRRHAIGTVLSAAGVAVLALGLFGTDGVGAALQLMGLGAALLFLGVAMLSTTLVVPLAAVVGWPIERLRGVTGRLARGNAIRTPARTATTAATLMIAVALVVFVGVFAAGLNRSIDDAVDRFFAGDLMVFNADGFSPISRSATPAIGEIEGVASASPVAGVSTEIDGIGNTSIWGYDPDTLEGVATIAWEEGSPATLDEMGAGGIVARANWAEAEGLEVGDELSLLTPRGERLTRELIGTIDDPIGALADPIMTTIEELREEFGARNDWGSMVAFEPGADSERVRERVDELLAASYPNAQSRSQEQLKEEFREQLGQLLLMIYALLGLSVIVSLFGIVNTLALTVYERTRELGMLRAIGAARSQVRTMIRYESVITSLIGAAIGLVLGLGIAVAAITALEEEGFVLSIPIGLLVAVPALAALAGVLAAIWPARRAARVEVMEALHYE